MATTTPSLNGRRTPETLRREIERERQELAVAVEHLREGLGEATNISAKLRSNLPVVAAGALAWKLIVAGGIGATMRNSPPRCTGTVTDTRPLAAICRAFHPSGSTATYRRRSAA